MDTPLVNGKAYPVLHVAPEAYRFQISELPATTGPGTSSWYVPIRPSTPEAGNKEVKMLPAIQPAAGSARAALHHRHPDHQPSLFIGLATAVLDATGNPINGTGLPAGCWPNFGSASQPGHPLQQTMWPADGREGGVPDPHGGPAFHPDRYRGRPAARAGGNSLDANRL